MLRCIVARDFVFDSKAGRRCNLLGVRHMCNMADGRLKALEQEDTHHNCILCSAYTAACHRILFSFFDTHRMLWSLGAVSAEAQTYVGVGMTNLAMSVANALKVLLMLNRRRLFQLRMTRERIDQDSLSKEQCPWTRRPHESLLT